MSVRKGYVDTDEGQIHYRYGGESHAGDPPVLCFHQNPSSSLMFEDLIRGLEDDYHVIAFDIPGYGQSYEPDDVTTFSYYTDVLTQAIDNLDVDRFHVLGHHTGAGTGVEIAVNEADRVETVCFIGPPYFSRAEREEILEDSYGESPDEAVPPVEPDGRHLLHHWELFDGQPIDAETQHRMALDALNSRTGAKQAHGVGRDQNFPDLFAEIEVPRLLMAAEGDLLWEAFCRAREDYPDVDTVEVGGAMLEPVADPDSVTSEVRRFLREHGY
ncbi:alpha/beta fold hydrolase [Halovivax limisalsi]|uniref:alpha/beta fold hydrolase n=1 Tax=Halovivax limisalsi TaxID=1453760 RepID=UPI001FFCECDD|nr:alpha/beta hydrolase [Halovivax limisalsi]